MCAVKEGFTEKYLNSVLMSDVMLSLFIYFLMLSLELNMDPDRIY